MLDDWMWIGTELATPPVPLRSTDSCQPPIQCLDHNYWLTWDQSHLKPREPMYRPHKLHTSSLLNLTLDTVRKILMVHLLLNRQTTPCGDLFKPKKSAKCKKVLLKTCTKLCLKTCAL